MKAKAKKTVAAYVRVSTIGQNEAGQRTEIQRWLAGNGINPFDGPAAQAAPAVALSAGNWEVSSSVRVVCRY